jgi:hypothetical protein
MNHIGVVAAVKSKHPRWNRTDRANSPVPTRVSGDVTTPQRAA